MEVETACRHKLPITFIIVNNNGIGGGNTELDVKKGLRANAYTIGAGYEKMIEGFGGKGYLVTEPGDLAPTLKEAMASDMPTIVNILIDTKANRRPQKFQWLTR
jgi:thiamine pyrophosphate-dependent acetolactate synthase large subunit-like protein